MSLSHRLLRYPLVSSLLLGLLLVLPATAAQPAGGGQGASAAEQTAAMAKLSQMIGQWKGRGWIEMPQTGRVEFHGGERVQSKLGGLALLVEGAFFHHDATTGQDVPSHTTLGVISYQPRTRSYRFDTWLATGMSGEQELKLTEDGWFWEITHPRGRIRYTTSFADGTWYEIGERSSDGNDWQKFFEMRLEKVNEAPAAEQPAP